MAILLPLILNPFSSSISEIYSLPKVSSNPVSSEAVASSNAAGNSVLTSSITPALSEVQSSQANAVLSAVDPYPSIIQADNPAVYYRLGETSGTVAADSSGHNVNGTYPAGVTLGVAGAIAGDSDTAVEASSSPDVLTAPSAPLPSGSASRTVEVWVKLRAMSFNTAILAEYNGIQFYYSQAGGHGNELGVIDTSTNTKLATYSDEPLALSDSPWYYFAFTWDANTPHYYSLP